MQLYLQPLGKTQRFVSISFDVKTLIFASMSFELRLSRLIRQK